MWSEKPKPWIIQNQSFTSIEALKTKLRDIANRHNWKLPGLHPLSPEDEAFVLEFFAEHPNFEEKAGAGIRRVLVGTGKALGNEGYRKNWCYYLETIDRSIPEDIGAMSCFSKYSKFDDFKAACYTAVESRATAIVERDFGPNNQIKCPETGEIITKQNCRVSYCHPTMKEIVEQFIAKYGLDLESIVLTGKTQRTFQDESLAKKFFVFHGDIAKMRVIGPRAFSKRMKGGCSLVPLARDSVGV